MRKRTSSGRAGASEETRPVGGKTLTVRQVRSGIGFSVRQKRTLAALGLGRIGRQRVHPDNPAVRGMISAVCHLVELLEAGAPAGGPGRGRGAHQAARTDRAAGEKSS